MKKAVILLLTFIYLIVASGMILNLHYCEGKINGISLAVEKKYDECCGEKGSIKKKCCEEKISVLKINDTQYSSTSLKTPTASANTSYGVFFQVSNLNNCLDQKTISNTPPDIFQNPIYLRYQILII